ncbi:Enamine deaminase RidA, house cleaning of reactive enamine intermediates, YjgF/YER057c/UK114 family [Georgenia satyanarayanai]|uniref:Enamine deaminase RidA, house cleaning of reactive enamine intermediates, YjgF/YER057c/UK114 family n=1 Tax=Georgenia satyanarayanai TaxID=860221 RepID=A0A2Y9AL81_9MICO|nr:RidA family protein [Georgenia satyanarayanai]PYF98948.1 enamine deaminase RidA (YjgF/YER057c/UK114 family) [Georgenia satyanarayanai]SSA44796.1 Enamine deaminase RidA, house cleaning of reactive enamine intermediates, YjgF/YER057c/UK114 family [Georgenia satyanarayanai]
MTVHRLSPAGLAPDTPYHHVAVATGTRHVHVAGQVGQDAEGVLAEGLAGQVAQALRNVAVGLRAGGATFDDVVRLTVYVTDWEVERIADFMAGVQAVAEEVGLSLPMPAASLIGVSALYTPEILVEIEATAVVD